MNINPAMWNELLAPAVGWQDAYAHVERSAREYLATGKRDDNWTTTELVEALYPEQFARGDGITARARIFKALAALAPRGLADCATRGPERRLKHSNKMVRPWLWHAPAERNAEAAAVCPNCGKPL